VIRRAFPLLAATLLVACGGGSGEPDAVDAPDVAASTPASTPAPTATPGSPDSTNTPAPDSPAAAVPEALQLNAPLIGGGEIELGAYAGRPVLLWFWAPW